MATATPNPIRAGGLPECELRHLLDTLDEAFAAAPAEHPEACSCADDYPDWTPGGTR